MASDCQQGESLISSIFSLHSALWGHCTLHGTLHCRTQCLIGTFCPRVRCLGKTFCTGDVLLSKIRSYSQAIASFIFSGSSTCNPPPQCNALVYCNFNISQVSCAVFSCIFSAEVHARVAPPPRSKEVSWLQRAILRKGPSQGRHTVTAM